jgi:hypothetical protein
MFRTVMDSACSGDSVGARLDTDDNNDDTGGRRLLAAAERKSRARCIVEQPRSGALFNDRSTTANRDRNHHSILFSLF